MSVSSRGFTLVELLVVMAIVALLLMVAVPQYSGSVQRSKEAVLKENLSTTRRSLEEFYADKGRYPEKLDELVVARYLRTLPYDPITDRDDTWIIVPPPAGSQGKVYDLRSGSREAARDGTRYGQW